MSAFTSMLPASTPSASELAGTLSKNLHGKKDKARGAAEDFESVFLSTMFNQMFTEVEGDGPFGGSQGVGVWRSFLTDEYAKSFAKSGGIGLADHVHRTLLAQQEVSARPSEAKR
jgi:peptidoglycan hydrolase FlgJ